MSLMYRTLNRIFGSDYGYCVPISPTQFECNISFDDWVSADKASCEETNFDSILVSVPKVYPKSLQNFVLSQKLKPTIRRNKKNV